MNDSGHGKWSVTNGAPVHTPPLRSNPVRNEVRKEENVNLFAVWTA